MICKYLVRLPVVTERLHPRQQRPRHRRPSRRRGRFFCHLDGRPTAAACARRRARLLLSQVLGGNTGQLICGQRLVPPPNVIEARGSSITFPVVGSAEEVPLALMGGKRHRYRVTRRARRAESCAGVWLSRSSCPKNEY